jgi:hypothetical protein
VAAVVDLIGLTRKNVKLGGALSRPIEVGQNMVLEKQVIILEETSM